MTNMKNATRAVTKFQALGNKLHYNFPRTYELIQILRRGSRQFLSDTLSFFRIKSRLSRNAAYASELNWKDIEIYRQVPRDWKRVAPVMIVSAFPFLNYVALPIAYFYPEQLLCHQFWSVHQKLKFDTHSYEKKVQLYVPLIDDMLKQADTHLSAADPVAARHLLAFLERVRTGQPCEQQEVLELRGILSRDAFALKNLSQPHVLRLVEVHNCRKIFNSRPTESLSSYSAWLARQDKQLSQKRIAKLDLEYIYNFSFERGLNPSECSIDELLQRLQEWLQFTQKLTANFTAIDNFDRYGTCLLHSKVFFKNNHPSVQ